MEFYDWLKEARKRGWIAFVIVASALHLAMAFKDVAAEWPGLVHFLDQAARIAPHAVHLVFILIALYFLGAAHSEHERLVDASKATTRFKSTWKTVWVVWLVLYLLFTVKGVLEVIPRVADWIKIDGPGGTPRFHDLWESAWWVGLNLLKNVQGALFFSMYVQLLGPIIKRDGLTEKRIQRDGRLTLLIAVALLAAGIEGLSLAWSGPSADQRFWSTLASSIWPGVGLALVVGRLESKLVSLPNLPVVLLYAYSAIQPAFAGLHQHTTGFAIFVLLALLLKMLLFMVVYWFLTQGPALFFFARLDDFDQVIGRQRKDFKKVYVDKKLPAPNDTRYDVFVSAPMASMHQPNFARWNDSVLAFVNALKNRGVGSVYYAGRQVKATAQYEDPGLSLRADMEAIRRSTLFVLIYPEPLASSALVEVGIATALRKPSLFFVASSVKELPFLMRDSDKKPAPVCVVRYDDMNELISRVDREWQQHVDKVMNA